MAGSQRGNGRRFWRLEEKRRIVAEARDRRNSVSMVARRHDLNANLLFTWMRDPRFAGAEPSATFLPVELVAAPPGASAGAAVAGFAGGFEIALPCGAVIRCGADVDAAALSRVISTVRRGG